MSEPPVEFPDFTVAVLDLIDSWFGPGTGVGAELHGEPLVPEGASTRMPTPGGDDALPWATAYVFGGDGDALQSNPVLDVHFFAGDYATASLLARRFHARFMQYPHRVSSSGRSVLFDRVEVGVLPAEVEYVEDDSIRRFQATYSFSIRR